MPLNYVYIMIDTTLDNNETWDVNILTYIIKFKSQAISIMVIDNHCRGITDHNWDTDCNKV